MLRRVDKVRVDAGLLQRTVDLALNLLLLSLLDSYLELLVLNFLRNRGLVESYRLHGSDLHGYLVCSVLVLLVELDHCSEGVLAHVIVDGDIVALDEVVTIDFHLLTGDTRAAFYSGLCVVAVSECQSLNLIEVLRALLDDSIEDLLYQGDEVLTSGNEVGLALHGNHCCEARNFLYEHNAIAGLTVGTLSGDGQTTLAENLLSLWEVAVSLCKCLFDISKTCTGHCTQFFDICN